MARRILRLPPDQQAAAARAALQLFGPVPVARTPDMTLRRFVSGAWHVVEPARRLIANWHIDAICEHLEAVSFGQIRRLIINVPPGHMKSLLVAVFWLAWEWTFAPHTRWLFSSYAQQLSGRDSRRCRNVILSPWYQRRWGHVYRLADDQNEKLKYENTATGFRIASSVGGVSTGERGDRVVFDDPLKPDDARSDLKREAVNTWWADNMSTRVNDPTESAMVGIAQRVHERDLPGFLLAQGETWEHLVLPSEWMPRRQVVTVDLEGEQRLAPPPRPLRNWSATSLGDPDPRTKPGALLWPQTYSKDVLAEQRRAMSAQQFDAQFNQLVAPSTGNMFHRGDWRFWVKRDEDFGPVYVPMPDGSMRQAEVVPLPREGVYHAQSWDMTFKDTDGSDFVVGQAWLAWKAQRFLLDQVRGHWDFPATVRQVLAFRKRWPQGPVWVEDKANGPAVIASLREDVAGLIAVDPLGDKVARARAEQQYVEAGNYVLPHPRRAPWVWDFIEELALFPSGAYDDQVDAFSQAGARFRLWLAKGVGQGDFEAAKK